MEREEEEIRNGRGVDGMMRDKKRRRGDEYKGGDKERR